MYFPMGSSYNERAVIVVRSQRDVTSLAIPVQQVVQSLDKDLPVAYVLTLNQLVGASTIDSSFTSTLILTFAVLSLVLAEAATAPRKAHRRSSLTPGHSARWNSGCQQNQIGFRNSAAPCQPQP